MADFIDGFLKQWGHAHEMTLAFVDSVPDAHWDTTPHPRFAPFSKQARHVASVRGVYNDTIANRRMDFGRKHDFYTGDLTRAHLRAGLIEKHQELSQLLESMPAREVEAWSVDFFGQPTGLAHFTYKMVQHEAIHHGEWSLYAALAGFETPRLWRLNWGL